MTDEGRKLRAPKQKGELFEYDLNYFDYDAPLVLVGSAAPSANSPRRRHHNGEVTKKEPHEALLLPLAPNRTPEALPESQDGDVLPISDFIGHHRRMERNEKRMQHLDLQQLMVDAEKVTAQREVLLAPHWRRDIYRIVKIDNTNDTSELERKRELALAEMGLFLSRFERLKRRERGREREREKDRQRSREKSTPPIAATRKASRPKKRQSAPPNPGPNTSSSDNSPELLAPLTLRIPKRAFGYPLPPRRWRPCEFDIPQSWKRERSS